MLLLILFYVFGIAFILLSIYLRYWRGKRKFERRNAAGLEAFKSYKNSLSTSYLENFVHFIYIFLTIVGIILLLMAITEGDDIKRMGHW